MTTSTPNSPVDAEPGEGFVAAADAAGCTEQFAGYDTADPAFAIAERLARFPVDILVQGETGTGKDCIARYVHSLQRGRGPFVPVNCAAIPEPLAEAELFGHEAGAFTGAVRSRAGWIEEANNGILYLDEVDSCPLWLQAKLLRALQDKGVERIGSSQFRPSSFRLIASTKAPLDKLVRLGRFRADLYFRLRVAEIHLHPLRKQPQRALQLFEQFALESTRRFGLAPRAMDLVTRQWVLEYDWPGNVRELKAAATRFALSLPLAQHGQPAHAPPTLRESLQSYERSVLVMTLKRCQGIAAKAAAQLDLPLNTLYYRLKRHGIDLQEFASRH